VAIPYLVCKFAVEKFDPWNFFLSIRWQLSLGLGCEF